MKHNNMSKPKKNEMADAMNALFPTGGQGRNTNPVATRGTARVRRSTGESEFRVPLGPASKGGRPRTETPDWKPHVWKPGDSAITSISVDVFLYERIRMIANKENMTLKDLMYFIFKDALIRYDSGELSLHD